MLCVVARAQGLHGCVYVRHLLDEWYISCGDLDRMGHGGAGRALSFFVSSPFLVFVIGLSSEACLFRTPSN